VKPKTDAQEPTEVKAPVKLIEGMKHLRVLEKRMGQQNQRINEYAALVSTEKPHFNNETAQKKEVQQLIQSNMDLVEEYLRTKRAVERTNLATVVAMGKKKYTISDLLVLKRNLEPLVTKTFEALNDRMAQVKMTQMQRVSGDQVITINRMYDEAEKWKQLRYWQELFHEIDSRLEVVNATTDLITE